MSKIIKNGQIIDDAWLVLKLAEDETPEAITLPDAPTLLPLAVWLESGEGPEAIANDLKHFAILGVNFPKFADGRGYSIARLLRERFAYTGEIRALGDVLQDQLFLLKRCGFDAFALRADKDIEAALAGFTVFSESYQAAIDQPQPLFRRRA